jgi:hypothetical protein
VATIVQRDNRRAAGQQFQHHDAGIAGSGEAQSHVAGPVNISHSLMWDQAQVTSDAGEIVGGGVPIAAGENDVYIGTVMFLDVAQRGRRQFVTVAGMRGPPVTE